MVLQITKLTSGRNRYQFEIQRSTIDQNRTTFFAKAGNKLVHNADARTHKFVLGILA